MKIAHIGNVDGIGSVLARFQQPDARVYCFDEETKRRFGGELVSLYDDDNDNKPELDLELHRSLLVRTLFLVELQQQYDVWHYYPHHSYSDLKENLEERRSGKKYLKHYHCHYYYDDDDLRSKHDNDFCLVSTPNLLQYAPNAVWLPTPVDLSQIAVANPPPPSLPPTLPSERKIRIAYYHPGYKQQPQQQLRLQQQYSYSNNNADDYGAAATLLGKIASEGMAETVPIFAMPHDEALALMAGCDIVMGNLLPHVGWFGKLELEAMALGKPVAAYVSDELYEKYRPPVYRVTQETFHDDLVALIRDENTRNRLGVEGERYVAENHDARKVVGRLQQYYEQV